MPDNQSTAPAPVKPYPNLDEVSEWFSHHEPPSPDHAAKYLEIHNLSRLYAEQLLATLPMDRAETAFALQRLEECVYWAVTAVSRS